MRTPLRAAIIGCGRIAGGYDEDAPAGSILTHAGAYRAHAAVDLVAVADADPARADAFAERWGAEHSFASPDRMLREVVPDVVSICTPDESHAAMLRKCLEAPIRGVWCEKPLVLDHREGRALVDEFARRGVPIAVNYLRRWDTAASAIGERIAHGDPAAVRITGLYGKGLRHSGSHAVDLLLSWLGKIRSFRVLSSLDDFTAEDPTVSVWLRFDSGAEAHLVGWDARRYELFELDVLGPGWRLRLIDSGERVEAFDSATADSGSGSLGPATVSPTSLHTASFRALDNLIGAILRAEPLVSDGESALATLEVCNSIVRSAMEVRTA